jgi:hypothetical protein
VEEKGNDAGDCELDDEECKAKSVAGVKKPLASETLQIRSRLRLRDVKKDLKKDDKKEIKKDDKKIEKKAA